MRQLKSFIARQVKDQVPQRVGEKNWEERREAKINRALEMWHTIKDLKEQLAGPRHDLRRILESMTNEEREAFYKRV